MLEGTGFPEGDLTIRIDGQLATDLDVQAVTERNRTDQGLVGGQELVTFMVPAGIGTGVVTVTTSGGSATVRSGFALNVLPDISPATDCAFIEWCNRPASISPKPTSATGPPNPAPPTATSNTYFTVTARLISRT